MMELAQDTRGAIRLDIGDPDFGTPPHVTDAFARATRDGFSHYGPGAGLLSTREVIATKLRERNGIQATPDQVVVTVGGCGALFLAFLSVLDPGDEVLVPDPGWPQMVSMAFAMGAVALPYRLDTNAGFVPDLDDLALRIGRRTKAVVVNSPGNPTGAILPRKILADLLALANSRGLWTISDECYDELVLEGEGVSAAAVGDADRIISVFSMSKTYAMTGWRLGYVVAPTTIAALMARAQEPMVSCAPTPVQKAAEAALSGSQDLVVEMRDAYRRRRDVALAVLDAGGIAYVRPRGAFYLMTDITASCTTSAKFALQLLQRAGVAVVPGSAFGGCGEGMVRISLAASAADVAEGVTRLVAELIRGDA